MDEARVALVTGGGRRIGRAIVERLAREGVAVVIHARPDSLGVAEALAQEIVRQGGQAAAIGADLADAQATLALMPRAAAFFGPINQLVNNASLFAQDAADNFDAVGFDLHAAVNLRAPLVLTQRLVAALPADGQGAVVNLIDQRVWRPTPDYFTYSLSKAGLWAATQTMAQAFAPRVRVNAVGPGPVLPNSLEGEAGFAAEVENTPLAHAVSPAEVADAVLWLLQAPSVTGQMIAVDAGQHLSWKTPAPLKKMQA